MATVLLYRSNTYLKQFSAVVKNCLQRKNGYEIILDQTCFYPEGGGQPADLGTIDNVEVLDVKDINGEIVHITSSAIEEGKTVSCSINWQRRFDHMQHHSGEHVVSGLVHKRFGYDNVGFHMGSIVTVDFNGILTSDDVKSIEEEANSVVYENLEISESYPSPQKLQQLDYRSKKELLGQVRIVTIPNTDVCACCGTHVGRTGEIGVIKLSEPVKNKNGVRLQILCGRKAMEDYGEKSKTVTGISQLLSAKPYEALEAVKQKCQESILLKQKLKETQTQLFIFDAQKYANENSPLFLLKENFDGNEIRELCLAVTKERTGAVLVASLDSENKLKFALGIKEGDIRETSKQFLKTLDGKGGGAAALVQGSINATSEEAEKLFYQMFL